MAVMTTTFVPSGMQGPVENDAVALVVIGTAVILPYIKVVDGRAEKELSDIVERVRPGIRDSITSPMNRPLDKRNMQTIIVRVCNGRVLAVVAKIRIRAAAVVIS